MGIRVTNSTDVFIKDCEGDVTSENSDGIVKDHNGGDGEFLESEFQIVSSRFNRMRVEKSHIELYDTIAKEVLKVTENGEDPIIQNLHYFAQRTIDAQDPKTKANGVAIILEYIKANKKYLDRLGYLATLDWILDLIGF